MNRMSDQLQNLADALSEEIVAAPALAAEAAPEHGGDRALAADFDRIVGRAERQARWRRLALRLGALAPAFPWRASWRPAMAAVAGVAVIVVAGDLYWNVRSQRPPASLASAPVEAAPTPPADKVAQRLAFDNERHDVRERVASAPAAAPPPPAPAAANAANESRRVRTVPIRAAEARQQPAAEPRARVAARKAPQAVGPQPQPRIAAVTAAPPPPPAAPAFDRAAQTRAEVPAFAWPLHGRVIAGFGAVAGGPFNDGIDIAVPAGTNIHAADDGVVSFAGHVNVGYGNLILLRHGGGFVTAYGHADKILVKLDDRVRRGQVIATSGTAGTLHFEVRKGATPMDPTLFLPKG